MESSNLKNNIEDTYNTYSETIKKNIRERAKNLSDRELLEGIYIALHVNMISDIAKNTTIYNQNSSFIVSKL